MFQTSRLYNHMFLFGDLVVMFLNNTYIAGGNFQCEVEMKYSKCRVDMKVRRSTQSIGCIISKL